MMKSIITTTCNDNAQRSATALRNIPRLVGPAALARTNRTSPLAHGLMRFDAVRCALACRTRGGNKSARSLEHVLGCNSEEVTCQRLRRMRGIVIHRGIPNPWSGLHAHIFHADCTFNYVSIPFGPSPRAHFLRMGAASELRSSSSLSMIAVSMLGTLFGFMLCLLIQRAPPSHAIRQLGVERESNARIDLHACNGEVTQELVGKGTHAGFCETRPTFYEICAGNRRQFSKEAGGNDKCLLHDEWDHPNANMLYTPTGPLAYDHSGHHYEALYPLYLDPLRNRSVALMELGTYRGDSLRLWLSYFRRPSHFALLDIALQEDNIKGVATATLATAGVAKHTYSMHYADQGSAATLKHAHMAAVRAIRESSVTVSQRHHNDWKNAVFDVIIDDGSHHCDHIQTTFNALFIHALRPGGIYVIEDLNVAYDKARCSDFIKGLIDFMHQRLLSTKSDALSALWPKIPSDSIASVNCVFEACAIVRSQF
jgi:hypothetical protein